MRTISVEDRIESSVAAAVEAMTNPTSRGGFEGRYAGIGSELGICLEAMAGTQHAARAPAVSKLIPHKWVNGEKSAAALLICAAMSSAWLRASRRRCAILRTAAARVRDNESSLRLA